MKIRQRGNLAIKAGFAFMAANLITGMGEALADQFHYNNVVIGDRALGLGGAYTGVSDDASGVYYNPAGLGFALSNDISGSANAFYKKTYTYKKTIGDQDYVERSAGSLPSFFGGIQKLDDLHKGLVAGFGIYATDSELRDQNDTVEGVALSDAVSVDRLHRTQNMRTSTFHYTAAAGLRVTSSLAVGFAVSYMAIDELFQDYQDVSLVYSASGTSVAQSLLHQNNRVYLTASGIEPTFAVQWAALPTLSLGFTVKKGKFLSQKYTRSTDVNNFFISGAFNKALEDKALDKNNYCQGVILNTDTQSGCNAGTAGAPVRSEAEVDNPLGSMPLKARGGLAWFASPRLLVTSDFSYFSAVDDAKQAEYKKEAVLDYAAGAEYYLTPSLPLRVGYFSNHDARKTVESGKTDQLDHVDFQGGTLFIAMVQPNSQISVGIIQQYGAGKAQKLAGSKDIQDIEVTSTTFALSASHNF